MSNFFALNLPKWSQMFVSGKPVTIEQAKDIIFRTDHFLTDSYEYAGGNERAFNVAYRKKAKLNTIEHDRNKQLQLRSSIQFVYTDFVVNDWASSAFIGGPHGWCSPSGQISFVDNVGKWPTISKLYDDWSIIAEAFPYLDLNVTLIHGELYAVDADPVVNFRVVDGTVTVETPNLTVHPEAVLDLVEAPYTFPDELGLPTTWYNEFAEKVAQVIDEQN